MARLVPGSSFNTSERKYSAPKLYVVPVGRGGDVLIQVKAPLGGSQLIHTVSAAAKGAEHGEQNIRNIRLRLQTIAVALIRESGVAVPLRVRNGIEIERESLIAGYSGARQAWLQDLLWLQRCRFCRSHCRCHKSYSAASAASAGCEQNRV
jgi:hypothetical protein